ncbi:hypothetical protein [Brachybacterium sp. YJGR34]|uniref:hypothetical protein n=1 Tax=Brachybacterium sp. YJGR34 TaxID=2059911 RepID=UPI0013001D34|nr:hypothetical protein [Brachybacterium sp. YJGR34]
MRDATIATSRTRATTDLIDYRPLPEEWGDLESLRALRATRTRAGARGLDPSTLELIVAPAAAPGPADPAARPARRRGLLALLGRGHGTHRRTGHGGGHLATA